MKTLWMLAGKIAFLFALPFMKLLPGFFSAPRVRVILKTPDGKILLVKNWFSMQRWSFPGGGVHDHETPEIAAMREVHEETGILIDPDTLRRIGEVKEKGGVGMTWLMYETDVDVATLPKLPFHRRIEIPDRRWWGQEKDLFHLAQPVEWYLQR